MENKKSPRADLERKRLLFLEIGFVLALALVLVAFEWTKEDVNFNSLGVLPDVTGEEEIIPITRMEQQKPPEPPKPQKVILELNIVDDDVVLEDEFDIEDFEASQDEEIEIIPMEEEADEGPIMFFLIEDPPEFQGGGPEEFRLYIQKQVEYPDLAIENGVSGTVYVGFVIDKTGGYSDVNILRSVDPLLDNAVIKAIKSAPKWTPGNQRGRPVPVSMTIPIKFILN